MHWTPAAKLEYLLRLPWTIAVEHQDQDIILHVREFPDASASGASAQSAADDLWDSLRASIESYLHFDDPIPHPAGMPHFPWELTNVAATVVGSREAEESDRVYQRVSDTGSPFGIAVPPGDRMHSESLVAA